VEPEKRIQLKFGDFDIRGSADDCDKGEVDVFSGTGKYKRGLGRSAMILIESIFVLCKQKRLQYIK